MARHQTQPFTETPPPAVRQEEILTPEPPIEEQRDSSVDATLGPDEAANLFLSGMDMVEQQRFLTFCEGRGLTPAAGIMLFLKEPLQRDQLNPIAANPFADEAQAVVDALQPSTTEPRVIARTMGEKPKKQCEVCGDWLVVDFLGRKLCKKESCWHTYAGLTPQQPHIPDGMMTGNSQEVAQLSQRVGHMEQLMARIAGTLDQLVGA